MLFSQIKPLSFNEVRFAVWLNITKVLTITFLPTNATAVSFKRVIVSLIICVITGVTDSFIVSSTSIVRLNTTKVLTITFTLSNATAVLFKSVIVSSNTFVTIGVIFSKIISFEKF